MVGAPEDTGPDRVRRCTHVTCVRCGLRLVFLRGRFWDHGSWGRGWGLRRATGVDWREAGGEEWGAAGREGSSRCRYRGVGAAARHVMVPWSCGAHCAQARRCMAGRVKGSERGGERTALAPVFVGRAPAVAHMGLYAANEGD